jgi:hypothetical protein
MPPRLAHDKPTGKSLRVMTLRPPHCELVSGRRQGQFRLKRSSKTLAHQIYIRSEPSETLSIGFNSSRRHVEARYLPHLHQSSLTRSAHFIVH